ncbi:cobamide remodeling phosphodiesterase CbiR [Desulfovibrio psychrotolerans]|uniref:Xylose isomerase n=1 Tax=Desulfovibrio psychrotolerans TaxID=415242 RepID=A0A7J0BVL1_9BACT|nr:cobamide remodeling phosphodiesterase CbiR [Desulfovibrio psychrotolerans]GFM37750.1 hypothetical protein DSM19430T_24340 [Desulfovibrio psychrotolerans]
MLETHTPYGDVLSMTGGIKNGFPVLRERTIAAPSWVVPDTLAANCRFLAGRVDEVGLLFFETKACLAYTRQDLPPDLAGLPLAWHVHLPLDLPWHDPEETARVCLALMDKVAFLGARRAVLHPPQPCRMSQEAAGGNSGGRAEFSGSAEAGKACAGGMCSDTVAAGEESAAAFAARSGRALEIFARLWRGTGRDTRDCLLENVRGADLTDVWPVIEAQDYGVCLDTGHVLSYGQHGLLGMPGLRERLRMVHLNAPGVVNQGGASSSAGQASQAGPAGAASQAGQDDRGSKAVAGTGKHLPLTALSDGWFEAVAAMLRLADPEAVLMMELFDWAGVAASIPVAEQMLCPRHGDET